MTWYKKILFVSLSCLTILQANAQIVVTNNGTAIRIESGITLTIDNGGFLNKTNGADLGTIDNAGTITLTKDWENNSANAVFSTNTAGIVQFVGTATQAIGGTSGTGTDFYDLTINNTSVAGITMSQPASVTNTFTLTDGIIYSDATNFVTMKAGSAVSPVGGTATEYVDGPIAKEGTTAFIFPIGDGTRWARAGIGAPTAATTFKAQYFATGHSNTDVADIDITTVPILRRVSKKEYWTLDRTVGAGDATVTLYWESQTFSVINNCVEDYLKIAHWNSVSSLWENNNPLVTYSCGFAGSVTTNLPVTSFSPFTFGSQSDSWIVNPLPIELLSFNAKPNVGKVDLMWVTASETNNDYFTLERTTDGVNFEEIGTVKGNGNSTKVINYSSEDNVPYVGISYYRLKQTDFDGKFTYSDLKMINFGNEPDFSFDIYPNPNDGTAFSMEVIGKNMDVLVVVRDMLGNELYSKVLITKNNDTNVHAIDPSQKLPPGVYTITATSNDQIWNKRLIVN